MQTPSLQSRPVRHSLLGGPKKIAKVEEAKVKVTKTSENKGILMTMVSNEKPWID